MQMRWAVHVHPTTQRHHVHWHRAGPGGCHQHEVHTARVQGQCTLVDYYLDELTATRGVLKYITNGKLILAGKDGSAYIKQAADFSYE